LLTADSLNDVQTTLRRLQWLHNQTLHDWGVAQGLAVSELEDGSGVQIDSGYALDSQGRELILNAPQRLTSPAQVPQPGPDTAHDWWVTISYRDGRVAADPDEVCRREAVPVRYLADPVVRWRDTQTTEPNDQLQPGLDVILATVTFDQGVIKAVTYNARRSAIPPARPRLYADRKTLDLDGPDASPWPSKDDPQGYAIDVNTSAAGFINPPQYFVTVEQGKDKPEDETVIARMPTIIDSDRGKFTLLIPVTWLQREAEFTTLLRALVSLVLLLLLVWGGSWAVSLLRSPEPPNYLEHVAGSLLSTAALAGGLYYGSTSAGRNARQGKVGEWYSALWGYPSGLVAGLSRWLGWRNKPPPPEVRVGAPIPNHSGAWTAVTGASAPVILGVVIYLVVNFLSGMFPVEPEGWGIFPDGAAPYRVLALGLGIVLSLWYGASNAAGQSAQLSLTELGQKWWSSGPLYLLRFIPDHLIHGIRYYRALFQSGKTPPAANGGTGTTAGGNGNNGSADKKRKLQVAWVGIEL
jgi:hypothetical protein